MKHLVEHDLSCERYFERTPLPILFASPDGYVRSASSAAARLLGLDLKGDDSRLPESLAERVRAVADHGTFVHRASIGEDTRTIEVTVTRCDDPSGELFVELEDVTDRQRAELETREAEQLREDFIHLVSHELRAPLTTILGYATMLERSVEASALGAHADSPRKIRERAEHMNRLVEELLTVARLESGRLQLQLEATSLADLATTAVEHLPARDRDRVVVDISNAAEAIVCDPLKLGHAIDNLLSNAAKYSPDGGEIRLIVRSDGGTTRISVSDRGVGIHPENLDQVFTRFGRLEDADASSAAGFGVGLYITKHLVECHGGEIAVRSTRGEGTTFTFAIPDLSPQLGESTASA